MNIPHIIEIHPNEGMANEQYGLVTWSLTKPEGTDDTMTYVQADSAAEITEKVVVLERKMAIHLITKRMEKLLEALIVGDYPDQFKIIGTTLLVQATNSIITVPDGDDETNFAWAKENVDATIRKAFLDSNTLKQEYEQA